MAKALGSEVSTSGYRHCIEYEKLVIDTFEKRNNNEAVSYSSSKASSKEKEIDVEN